ncbi:MAG: EAL domain-containing protein [Actinomycetota bacterium]
MEASGAVADRAVRWAAATPWRRVVGIAVVFTTLYAGSAVAFREFAPDRGFSPLFPPAGIMFSLFVAAGARWLPFAIVVRFVTIRLFFADGDDSLASDLVEAVLIATPYALCAEFLRRGRLERAHPPEFAWFSAVGVVLAPTLATVGLTLQLVVVDDQAFGDAFSDLRAFWIGDALAIASITPLTLLLMRSLRVGRPRSRMRLSTAERTEYALMVLAIAAAPLASSIFVSRGGPPAAVVVATLPLLWVALRQDLIQAAIGIVVSVFIVSIALRRALPFDELVEVQYLLLCGTVAALFAAAVRRAHEDVTAVLSVEQGRYAQVDRHAPLYFTELDVGGDRRRRAGERLSGELAAVHAGVEERWARFGPSVLRQRGIVPFAWSSDGSAPRFFDSIALPVDSPTGDVDHVLVVTTDRTELRRATDAVHRVQTHDVETGLVNRREFRRLIDESIDRPDGSPGVAVISFPDIVDLVDGSRDGITPAGLTVDLAERVARQVGDAGRVGRIGDHVLGVLAWGVSVGAGRLTAIRALAEGVLDDLAAAPDPLPRVPVSIGVAEGGASSPDVLARAELAARAARELGGDRILVYHPALHESRRRQQVSVEELRRACDRGEFEVHYQPIFQFSDRSLVGVEALLRWQHPTNGLLYPDRFIRDAERSGLIVRIDNLVLRLVAEQVAGWIDAGTIDERFSASVNISPVHLADPDLLNDLRVIADRVDARRIRLEITESAAMRDPEYTVDVLSSVRSLGYTVILDDFGTGYSSMAWLHRLPAQILKIDRTFVRDLATDADSRRIVEVMVSLARDLGLGTTAEGIETDEQSRILAEIGCDYGQGFLLGRPVPASELVAGLRTTS